MQDFDFVLSTSFLNKLSVCGNKHNLLKVDIQKDTNEINGENESGFSWRRGRGRCSCDRLQCGRTGSHLAAVYLLAFWHWKATEWREFWNLGCVNLGLVSWCQFFDRWPFPCAAGRVENKTCEYCIWFDCSFAFLFTHVLSWLWLFYKQPLTPPSPLKLILFCHNSFVLWQECL